MKIKTGKTATMMAVMAFLAMVCFAGTVGAETSDTVKAIEDIATEEAAATSAAATTGAMDLVKMLTSQLGVTENQAAGGAGSLFGMAQGMLSESDYGQVAAAIPGIGDLIKAAPAVSESTAKQSDKMSGLTQGLGSLTKAVDSAGKYTAVYDQFKQLGLSKDMVSQFVPVILSFTESAGGEPVMNILKSVWQ